MRYANIWMPNEEWNQHILLCFYKRPTEHSFVKQQEIFKAFFAFPYLVQKGCTWTAYICNF